MSQDDRWREVELNPRPAPLWADRTAVLHSPLSVTIRFLVGKLYKSRLNDDRETMELTNVAEIALHPAVAKQLIVDLTRAVSDYEVKLGPVPSLQEIAGQWRKVSQHGQGPKEPQ